MDKAGHVLTLMMTRCGCPLSLTQTPFRIAHRSHRRALAEMLHPLTPWETWVASRDRERLRRLAAATSAAIPSLRKIAGQVDIHTFYTPSPYFGHLSASGLQKNQPSRTS